MIYSKHTASLKRAPLSVQQQVTGNSKQTGLSNKRTLSAQVSEKHHRMATFRKSCPGLRLEVILDVISLILSVPLPYESVFKLASFLGVQWLQQCWPNTHRAHCLEHGAFLIKRKSRALL